MEIASAKKWSDGQKELLRFAAERGSQGIPEGCHLFEQCKGGDPVCVCVCVYVCVCVCVCVCMCV